MKTCNMWNLITLLQLLLNITTLLATRSYAPSDAIMPDYDLVNEIFSSPKEMRQKRSADSTTYPGLGGSGVTPNPEQSGSGGLIGSGGCAVTPETTDAPGTDTSCVDLIENCTLPISAISSGEEEMTARFRGICHSVCLEELDKSLDASTRRMLLGYPLWPQGFLSYKFSDDGIRGVDCLLPHNPNGCHIPGICPDAPNELLDCQRGCMTRFEGVTEKCEGQCKKDCKGNCYNPSGFVNGFGCSSNLLPNPLCNIVCEKRDCKSGCQYGGNYLARDIVYPSDFESLGVTYQPTGPPAVNHIYGTRYSVNISSAIPVNPLPYDTIVNFGFTTVIIRVAGQRATRFYVLDRSTEINLDYFACQTVNVTFQVASANRGFSNFSHPLVMDVMNLEVYVGDFPDQLSASSVRVMVSVDDRVGFFNYHVVKVSWALPNNHQFAEGYYLSMNSVSSCGRTTVYINDSTVTDHTFQVTAAERDSSAIVLPLTACIYTMKIEVIPRHVVRQDEVFSVDVITRQYSDLTVDDLMLNCSSAQSLTSNEYDVSLRVTYSPTFTPATIFAISYIMVSRYEFNENDDLVPNGNGATLAHRLRHIDNVTLQSSVISTLSPLDLGHSYQFGFFVFWKADLPRGDHVPYIKASCFVREVGPFPHDAIPKENILIVSQELFALSRELYQADIEFNFKYEQPGDRQVHTGFEVWFFESLAPNTDNLPVGVQRLGPLQTSGMESKIVQIQSDSINLYFQLRVLTMDTISRWSNPLLLEFTTRNTQPPTIAENAFNITQFTYRTSPGDMGDVVATVTIEIQHNIQTYNSSVRLELWLGDEQLSADQVAIDMDYVKEFSIVGNSSRSIERSLSLPSLGVSLYLQIRALNLAEQPGNWSSPEVIYVEEIPPPVIETIPILSNIVPVRNEDGELISFNFTLEIDLASKPTDDPTTPTNISTTPPIFKRRRKREAVRESGMVVSELVIAIGFKPVEDPYGDVPSSSVEIVIPARSDAVQVSNTISLDEFDSSNSKITLFLQIRSVAGGANGMWSEPIPIPVLIDLVSKEVTFTEVGKSSFPLILGTAIPFGIIGIITLVLIAIVCIFFCYKQYQIRDSFKIGGGDDGGMKLWMDDADASFIPEGMVKGKELLVDCWEIPTTEVIVENHLGEGAFGLVFKGTIRGPLRNPKLSSKLKQTFGLPIAVKLLKDTASRKERSDFLVEIDMMKKISEGCCPNIVNMVGCVTLQEPLCLITEFVPYGDLLDYLRNQRKKNASRQREEKYLRVQLEQQRKAYEEMKRKMEMLQYGQTEDESRITAGSSGYADFSDVSSPQNGGADSGNMPQEEQQQQGIVTPHGSAEEEPRVLQFTNKIFGDVEDEKKKSEEDEEKAAPYMESVNEYSHLDVQPTDKQVEATIEDQDIYADIGELDANDLMQFAYQISTGMEYLSSINIVHRDLACRNVLVGEGKNLKITDFGLSREVEDVYVKTTKGRLPLKWMALESIDAREFTTQSDVWSYGITLWEIGTMGGFPYPTIQNQNLLMMLKQGYRLEKPENCAAEVYNIMLECWQEHPIDRPTFPDLRKKFSTLLLASTTDSYMVLEIDESKTYYTLGEEEEKNFKGSEESLSSTDSNKKPKKKIEKPKWAQDADAYGPTSSTFKEGHAHVEDEHYRHNSSSVTVGLEENKPYSSTIEAGDVTDTRNEITQSITNGRHVPGVLSLSLEQSINLRTSQPTPVSLDDQVGIPLSFVMGSSEKQTGHDAPHDGRGSKKTQSNPYVEDPRTLHPLEVVVEDRRNGSLTSDLNSKFKVARMGDEEALTIM